MDDRRRPATSLTKILGWLISLLAIGFLFRWISGLGSDVWTTIADLDAGYVVISLVLFLPFFGFRALAWERISDHAGASGSRWPRWRTWALSELARYIPGNVLSLAVRYRGARTSGADRPRSILALIVEALALVGGAGLVASFTLPIGWYAMGAIAVTAVAMLGIWLSPHFIRRWRPEAANEPRPPVVPLLLMDTLAWMFYGFASATLWLAFPASDAMSFSTAMGVSVAAWMLGYLSIITPMGLGVREVAFVALVPAALGAELASLVAIVTRLGMAVAEVIFFGIVSWLGRRS